MEEPIIIDGVDVNECAYFDYENEGTRECDAYGNECEANNCYFKQLARKTQELKTICKAFDIEYGYDEETGAIVGRCNKLIEKEKVLEGYKQSLDEKNKFLQDLGISASGEFKRIKFYIESLKNKYNEKVEECEELKRKVELMMDCPDCKVDEYKKALDEIEKVINNILNSCLGRNTVSCRPAHNVCGDLINILDIINKAKGGGECQ